MTNLDHHNQPLNRNLNIKRVQDRQIDELIGICKGIIIDNIVTFEEVKFLKDWMYRNRESRDRWPVSILYDHVVKILKDNILDKKEQKEVLELIKSVVGNPPDDNFNDNLSATLALNNPPPEIIFKDNYFCLTGKFVTGARKHCETLIQNLGGLTQSNLVIKTDYIIIGLGGSRDWIHSSYGRKIEKAVKMRERTGLKIISEQHWADSMNNIVPAKTEHKEKKCETLQEYFHFFSSELKEAGWCAEHENNSFGVKGYYKNGKPKKTFSIKIEFYDRSKTLEYDIEKDEFMEKTKKLTGNERPWRVDSWRVAQGQTFSCLHVAMRFFMQEVQNSDPVKAKGMYAAH